jgi:hypothetical protein
LIKITQRSLIVHPEVEAINSERIAVGEAVNHDPGRCRKFPAENHGSQAIDTLGLLSGRILMSSYSYCHSYCHSHFSIWSHSCSLDGAATKMMSNSISFNK